MRPSHVQGLCPDCRFVRYVRSAKGSTFLLCGRAKDDPRLPKYPAQPRLVCTAFERAPRGDDGPPPGRGARGA